MLMAIMLVASLGTTVSATDVTTTENVGFTDLTVVLSSNVSGHVTLSVWWQLTSSVKNYGSLAVNITVKDPDGNIHDLTENTVVLAIDHTGSIDSWNYDAWAQAFTKAGTYVFKVSFANLIEPTSNNTLDNEISLSHSINDGIFSDLMNGLYSVTFLIDKAITDTGLAFLGEIPFLSFIIIVIVIIVIYLLYRRAKKKRAYPQMPMRRTTSYRETVGTLPAYNQKRPPRRPYDDYSDNYY